MLPLKTNDRKILNYLEEKSDYTSRHYLVKLAKLEKTNKAAYNRLYFDLLRQANDEIVKRRKKLEKNEVHRHYAIHIPLFGVRHFHHGVVKDACTLIGIVEFLASIFALIINNKVLFTVSVIIFLAASILKKLLP